MNDHLSFKHFHFPWAAVHLPVVPAVFDNSLSLLEVSQKLLHWVNETIAYINTVKDQLDELTAYVEAQDYDAAVAAAKAYTDQLNATLTAYVNAQLALKQDVLTFDALPQYNSANPVTSNGIKTYIDGLREYIMQQLTGKQNVLTFDSAPAAGSDNPVTSAGIAAAISAVNKTRVYTMTTEGNNLVVRNLDNDIITPANLMIQINNNNMVYIVHIDGSVKAIYRVVGVDSASKIKAINEYNELTGDPLGTTATQWTITTLPDQWQNIKLDYDGTDYTSTTGYADILARFQDVTKAPPFVSVYSSGQRVRVLYCAGVGGDDNIYFTSPGTTITGQLDAFTIRVDRTNAWHVVT